MLGQCYGDIVFANEHVVRTALRELGVRVISDGEYRMYNIRGEVRSLDATKDGLRRVGAEKFTISALLEELAESDPATAPPPELAPASARPRPTEFIPPRQQSLALGAARKRRPARAPSAAVSVPARKMLFLPADLATLLRDAATKGHSPEIVVEVVARCLSKTVEELTAAGFPREKGGGALGGLRYVAALLLSRLCELEPVLIAPCFPGETAETIRSACRFVRDKIALDKAGQDFLRAILFILQRMEREEEDPADAVEVEESATEASAIEEEAAVEAPVVPITRAIRRAKPRPARPVSTRPQPRRVVAIASGGGGGSAALAVAPVPRVVASPAARAVHAVAAKPDRVENLERVGATLSACSTNLCVLVGEVAPCITGKSARKGREAPLALTERQIGDFTGQFLRILRRAAQLRHGEAPAVTLAEASDDHRVARYPDVSACEDALFVFVMETVDPSVEGKAKSRSLTPGTVRTFTKTFQRILRRAAELRPAA